MPKFVKAVWRWALTRFVLLAVISAAALAADLSRYRDFQFGTDLATVAKQAGASPSQAKVIHLRPAPYAGACVASSTSRRYVANGTGKRGGIQLLQRRVVSDRDQL